MRVASLMSLLLGAAFVALVAGCGGSSTTGRPSPERSTHVSVFAVNPNVGRALFEIYCPVGKGDGTSSARVCAELRKDPELVTKPAPFICGFGENVWDFTISGEVNGYSFRSHTESCWTSQMELIGKLGLDFRSHLLPRRTVKLIGPELRRFPPGELRPADLVTCKIDGTPLEMGVPIRTNGTAEAGFDRPHVRSLRLDVTRNGDGTVIARCYSAKPLPKKNG